MKIMKKRQGFTLIELIAVVAILSLVTVIAGITVNKIIDNAGERSIAATKNNILTTARVYIEDYSKELNWTTNVDEGVITDEKYICVSIEELINKGLIKSDIKDKIEESFVTVWKDKNGIITKETFDNEKCSEEKAEENNLDEVCSSYEINYHANDGTNSLQKEKYEKKEIEIKTNIFERVGYKLSKWNTQSNGTGKDYEGGKNLLTECSLDLYAIWRANSYTIKFDSNGGTGTMPDNFYEYGKSYKLSENIFTKDGYAFIGWNTKADGTGTTYSNKAIIENLSPVDNDEITLYAMWKIPTYKVYYNGNGNTDENYTKSCYKTSGICGLDRYTEGSTIENSLFKDERIYKYDSSYALRQNLFLKTGYSRAGWNTKADGTGKSYTDKESVQNLSAKDGETIILYAQWTPITYNVYYDGNGNTDENYTDKCNDTTGKCGLDRYTEGSTFENNLFKDERIYKYDSSYSLRPNRFLRTGYQRGKWNTQADGTGTTYDNDDTKKIKNLTTTNNSKVILYAMWEPNTYRVYYNGNGHTSQTYDDNTKCNDDKECGLERYASGSKVSGVVFRHEKERFYDKKWKLPTNKFKKTGYTFVGWNTKADGSGTTYTNEEEVSNVTTKNEGIVILYAMWKDSTSPTCTITKTDTGSTDGVDLRVNCSDSGSGCKTDKKTYSNVKSDTTYTVEDNAGNKGTCSVNISYQTKYSKRTYDSCATTKTLWKGRCIWYKEGSSLGNRIEEFSGKTNKEQCEITCNDLRRTGEVVQSFDCQSYSSCVGAWGNWSGYIYTTCTSSSTTECSLIKQYY